MTVAETASTNDDVLALARDGAPEGVWLRAERQTAGRGRLGRVWQSLAGNLHVSTLVRLRAGDPPAPTLALVAGVALHDALMPFADAVPLALKWPNDVIAGGAKLAGILLERQGDAVVVGFGANLAHAPIVAGRETVALADRGAAAPSAYTVAELLADAFVRALAEWRGRGLAATVARWERKAHPRGTALRVAAEEGEMTGLFDGLDAGGALRLRLADGTARVIHAGDVFLIRD